MPQREQVKISLPAELVVEMDRVRQGTLRSTFIQAALERWLKSDPPVDPKTERTERKTRAKKTTDSGGSSAPHPPAAHADEVEFMPEDPADSEPPDPVDYEHMWDYNELDEAGGVPVVLAWANFDSLPHRLAALELIKHADQSKPPPVHPYRPSRGESIEHPNIAAFGDDSDYTWEWLRDYLAREGVVV